MTDYQTKYLSEVGRRLRREGFTVQPEYAVISVGYNRYGHPAPEVLERLAAAGCEIYRTGWSGTLTFTVRDGG